MEPITDYGEELDLYGAGLELISAMSTLNMEADPIPEGERCEGALYLSETDAMAKHAQGHIHAAIQLVHQGLREYEMLAKKVDRLLDRLGYEGEDAVTLSSKERLDFLTQEALIATGRVRIREERERLVLQRDLELLQKKVAHGCADALCSNCD